MHPNIITKSWMANLIKFNLFIRTKASHFVDPSQYFHWLPSTLHKQPPNITDIIEVNASVITNNSTPRKSRTRELPELLFERVIEFKEKKNIFFSLLRWRNWLQILDNGKDQ